MPKISQRNRTRARAWSAGSAGPALGDGTPTYRGPVAGLATPSTPKQNKTRAQIRDEVITAMIRGVTVTMICRTMVLSRGDVTAIGHKAGRELDPPTDRMLPRGQASDPAAILRSDVEQDFTDQALCAQTDPDAFFPEKGDTIRDAKKVCRNCPVTAECLELSLELNIQFGVWGGLSENERRPLRRQRRISEAEAA